MEALLGTYALVLGSAGLMPRISSRPGLDGRFFSGLSFVVLMLFFGQVGLGLDYRSIRLILLPLAAIGLILWFRQGNRWLRTEFLTHPVLVLPVLLALLVGIRGGDVDYLPLAWDEYSNWLPWAKQYLKYGNVVDSRIIAVVMGLGYTPGWPLVLALQGLWRETFNEGGALMVFALMHMAVLGLAYDVMLGRLRRTGYEIAFARLIAWAVILGLLAVEASWKLVPINLLIEEPQTYCLVACVLLAFGWWDEAPPAWRVALPIGLICAMGYVIKSAILTFAPSLFVLFAAFLWLRGSSAPAGWKRLGGGGSFYGWAALATPLLATIAVWRLLGPHFADCLSQPNVAFAGAWARLGETERVLDLWHRYWAEVFQYLCDYKLIVTVGAALCLLVAAVMDRFTRVILAAFVLYWGIYFLSLYAYHLDCLGEYYFNNLNSIERFVRVPLRVLHVIGPVVLLHCFADRLFSFGNNQKMLVAAAGVVVLLGTYQLTRMNASLHSVAGRADADPVLAESVRTVRDAALAINKYRPGTDKTVIFVDQGGQGFAPHIARYFGYGSLQAHPVSSWGEKPANVWMQSVSQAELKQILLGASVVVPLRLDGWMTDLLKEMAVDSSCLSPPSGFLVPDLNLRTIRCVRTLP